MLCPPEHNIYAHNTMEHAKRDEHGLRPKLPSYTTHRSSVIGMYNTAASDVGAHQILECVKVDRGALSARAHVAVDLAQWVAKSGVPGQLPMTRNNICQLR